jgi:hypothetical protein
MNKVILSLLVSVSFLSTTIFSYSWEVINTTGSKLRVEVDVAGNPNNAIFEVQPHNSDSRNWGIYCARSITVTALDGRLAGQTANYSLGANTCRPVSITAKNTNGALQVS